MERSKAALERGIKFDKNWEMGARKKEGSEKREGDARVVKEKGGRKVEIA